MIAACGPVAPLVRRVLDCQLGWEHRAGREAVARARIAFAGLVRDLLQRRTPDPARHGPVRLPTRRVLEDALRSIAERQLREPFAVTRWLVITVNDRTPAPYVAPPSPGAGPQAPVAGGVDDADARELRDVRADAEATARRQADEARVRDRRLVLEQLHALDRATQFELALVARVPRTVLDEARGQAWPRDAADIATRTHLIAARNALADELAQYLDGGHLSAAALTLLTAEVPA